MRTRSVITSYNYIMLYNNMNTYMMVYLNYMSKFTIHSVNAPFTLHLTVFIFISF